MKRLIRAKRKSQKVTTERERESAKEKKANRHLPCLQLSVPVSWAR